VSLPAFRSPAEPSAWTLPGLAGRLVEISGAEDSAALTLALGLVRQAQLMGEPAAWITPVTETFFPPDAAAGGVDLAALAIVRVPDPRALPRAADQLAQLFAAGVGLEIDRDGALVAVERPPVEAAVGVRFAVDEGAGGAGAAGAFMPTKLSATSPKSCRMVARPLSSATVA